jgi:hypothetical protein
MAMTQNERIAHTRLVTLGVCALAFAWLSAAAGGESKDLSDMSAEVIDATTNVSTGVH